MTNHFKAIHRETKEEILFSLGSLLNMFKKYKLPASAAVDWLKDYELFYQHQGEYYRYETNKA